MDIKGERGRDEERSVQRLIRVSCWKLQCWAWRLAVYFVTVICYAVLL